MKHHARIALISLAVIATPFASSPAEAQTANTIYACYQKNEGQLRRVSGPGQCKPSEIPLSWSTNGTPGPKGDKGDTGPQGPQGPKGDKGEKGDQGIPGLKGDKGDKGDQGIQGLKGDKGDKGDQGIQGPQGVEGEKGDIGPEGPPGDGHGVVNAGAGDLSQTGGLNRSRLLVAQGDFELWAQCTTNGPSFFVKNLAPFDLNVLRVLPGQEATVLPVPANSFSLASPEKAVTTVTFLSGRQQNSFIFTAWGQKTDTGCSVSGVSTSEIP